MRYRFCTYHKRSGKVPETHRQAMYLALIGAVIGLLPLAFSPLPVRADSSQPTGESVFHNYQVRRGETLAQLARRYGLSKHELAASNHLTTASILRRGQKLRVPTSKRSGVKEAEGASKPPAITLSNRNDADRRISLNFSDVEVRQALTTISDYSRTDIMVMPGGTGNVSISLRGRTPDEAIRLTAATAGLSVVKVGPTYLVGKAEEVKKAITEFGQTQMVPLRKASFQEAKEFLARATPLVSVEAAGNGILLTGLPDDIAAARTALRDLDENRPPVVVPKQDTNIFTLRYADPESVEKILHEAMPDMRVVLQDRTLILSGTQVMLAAADLALKQIDVETSVTSEKGEAAVYHLKYLNAQTAETSLKKAFPNLNIAVAPEPNAPPTAIFSPLSINTLGGNNGGMNGGGGASGSGQGGGTSGNGGQGSGNGGQSGVAQNQPLSRSVRLIVMGPSSEVKRALLLLEQTDVAPPLVRIEAALVEVNRSNVKDLGLGWDFTNTKFTFTIPGAAGVDVGQIRRDGLTDKKDANFTVSLQALITQNKARVLAAPNISVVDNEDANIFIGDLLRFPGSTVVTPNSGTVQNIETIPVGIALLVRPRIHPNDEVTLKVHPVVSAVSNFVNGVPQTSSREADTTVRLRAGEELVIGGLSRKEFTTTLQKVPLLGDLPIIGQLFQTRNHRTTETEILIFIRVYPVQTQPAPLDQASILPEDALERTDKRLRTQKPNTKQAPK